MPKKGKIILPHAESLEVIAQHLYRMELSGVPHEVFIEYPMYAHGKLITEVDIMANYEEYIAVVEYKRTRKNEKRGIEQLDLAEMWLRHVYRDRYDIKKYFAWECSPDSSFKWKQVR